MIMSRCNKCGKDFDIFDEQEDFSIDRILGYGTKHDGEHLKIRFCCKCMDEIIDSCEISPFVED